MHSDEAEIFVAGARFDDRLSPFSVRTDDIDMVQYGSDDTKTHEKSNIFWARNRRMGRPSFGLRIIHCRGRRLAGFPPHKYDTDRVPDETRHDEVYNFRSARGRLWYAASGARRGQAGRGVSHCRRVQLAIKSGYHPCVVAPGYEMYYFTILGLEPAFSGPVFPA